MKIFTNNQTYLGNYILVLLTYFLFNPYIILSQDFSDSEYLLTLPGKKQPQNWQIKLKFDAPLYKSEIESKIIYTVNAKNEKTHILIPEPIDSENSGKHYLTLSSKEFVIFPSKLPDIGSRCLIKLKGLKSSDGLKEYKSLTIDFKIIPHAKIVDVKPYYENDNNCGFIITLDKQVFNFKTLASQLRILTPVKKI